MFFERAWDAVSRARYKIAIRVRVIIDIVVLAVGIALAFFGGTDIVALIGVALTAISAILLFTNLWKDEADKKRTRVVANPDFLQSLRSARLANGFELKSGAIPRSENTNLTAEEFRPYITSEDVNAILDKSANPLAIEEVRFEVPRQLREFRARSINIKLPNRNDPKIGLRNDITVDVLANSEILSVQETDYFSGAATNEMACDQFMSVPVLRSRRPSLQFAVADLIIDNNELVGLSESSLSNHIGISTVVFTADSFLVLQEQDEQMISSKEVAIGASGSLDLKDIEVTRHQNPTLQGLVRFGMEREATEELSAAFWPNRQNTNITGYARYLARGGKPEFFGITRTTSIFSELKPTKKDVRYVKNIVGRPFEPNQAGLARALEEILGEGQNSDKVYSMSMVVSLQMALSYLAKHKLVF